MSICMCRLHVSYPLLYVQIIIGTLWVRHLFAKRSPEGGQLPVLRLDDALELEELDLACIGITLRCNIWVVHCWQSAQSGSGSGR